MLTNYPLIRALYSFLSYAPWRITLLYFGSILQSFSSVIGLFLLLPLAKLAGVDFDSQKMFSSWSFLNQVVQTLVNYPLFQSLSGILFVFVALSITVASLSYLQTMMGAQLQREYIQYMRLRIYNALITSSWHYLSASRSSEFLHRIGAQVQSVNASANQFLSLLNKVVMLVVYCILMLLLDWKFTVMTLLVALIIAAILFPIRYSVRDAGKMRLEKYKQVFRLLSEHLSSLKMIKSSGHEWQFQQSLKQASDELEWQQVRMMKAGAIVAFVNKVALAVGFCVLLYISLSVLKVPLMSFLLLFFIMSRLLPQVASLQTGVQQIIFSLPGYEDIEKTLDECQQHQELIANKGTKRLSLQGEIEFRRVSFQYQSVNGNEQVIHDLSVSIKAKETIALIGKSGAGKTTMADLIIGLLTPQQGEILIDGQQLHADNLAKWRRSVAYVTQDIRFFHDTVRNNLVWVNNEATESEIWDALETAAIKDKINSLPQKLDTLIGDGGNRLSGGERQRLAIARALLSKPDVLVLDEATSALDAQNEKHIHQALVNMQGELTVVIIAHSPNTIAHADRILNLSASPPAFVNIDDVTSGKLHTNLA